MHLHFTHTHTYTYSKEFGTLLPIYVMHLVKLLFPKSLILDLFVVQIKCILVFSPGSRGKIPKNIWILSQYWRLLVLVTRAWMLKWFQFQPTHPPTIVLNLSLLFSGKHGPLPPPSFVRERRLGEETMALVAVLLLKDTPQYLYEIWLNWLCQNGPVFVFFVTLDVCLYKTCLLIDKWECYLKNNNNNHSKKPKQTASWIWL